MSGLIYFGFLGIAISLFLILSGLEREFNTRLIIPKGKKLLHLQRIGKTKTKKHY